MKYQHRQTVRITRGFFKGVKGSVLSVRGFWIWREYEIDFEWHGTKSWDARVWIPGKYLSAIKAEKNGNVLKGDFKKRRPKLKV